MSSQECTVRRMRADDIPRVSELLHESAHEVYAGAQRERARERLLASYAPARLEAWLSLPDKHLWVAGRGTDVCGFLVTSMSCKVGHLHWITVDRQRRNKGVGTALVRRALRSLARADCFLVDLFANPRQRNGESFWRSFGFERKARLERTLIGVPSAYMTLALREASDEEMTRRIIVVGDAGQGIRLLGHILASVLASLGKHVALNVTKPSSVRGGTIAAELSFSEEPIRTPFFVDADILIQLSPGRMVHTVRAKHVILDEALAEEGLPDTVRRIGRSREDEVRAFVREAREGVGSAAFTNMVVLGRILGHMGLNIANLDLAEELPQRFLEENLRAIELGYSFDLPQAY